MNLHAVVRAAITTVNPDVAGSIRVSTGAVTLTDGTRMPTYAQTDDVPMQVQPLTGKDLAHLDNLNIQGVQRAIYVNGDFQGVVRPDGKGGDLIRIGTQVWLIVAVLETWATGWCKVGVTLQKDAAWI